MTGAEELQFIGTPPCIFARMEDSFSISPATGCAWSRRVTMPTAPAGRCIRPGSNYGRRLDNWLACLLLTMRSDH